MPFSPKRYSRLVFDVQRAMQRLDAAPAGAKRKARKDLGCATARLDAYAQRWPAPALAAAE